MKVTRRDSKAPKEASIVGRALHDRLNVSYALCAQLTQGVGMLKETEEGCAEMKDERQKMRGAIIEQHTQASSSNVIGYGSGEFRTNLKRARCLFTKDALPLMGQCYHPEHTFVIFVHSHERRYNGVVSRPAEVGMVFW